MSKAVLISIQPKWAELIANGKKTVEVRKSLPKIDTPFKCYIYCTKAPKGWFFMNAPDVRRDGKIIGEFVCDKIHEYEAEFHEDNKFYQDIREIFRSDDNIDDDCRDFHIISTNEEYKPNNCKLCWESCLTFDEIKRYIGKEGFCLTFYGWHISDLKIYDRPKELPEFKGLRATKFGYEPVEIKRAPQSWCYVEEREDNG